jgi:uncharacterized protein (DUF488 family)
MKTIFTIGHSTRSEEEFYSLLAENRISVLADVRRFPGSRRYPQFNRESLINMCRERNIEYLHFESLGGRRKPVTDSKNTEWKHEAFRGYADYQETDEYQNAIQLLINTASESSTAYMCSEALWWKCHRALISDDLKNRGWRVMHILGKGKTEEHPYTTVARQHRLL